MLINSGSMQNFQDSRSSFDNKSLTPEKELKNNYNENYTQSCIQSN